MQRPEESPRLLLQPHVLFQTGIPEFRFVHGTCRVLKCHVADTSEPVPDPASTEERAGPDCVSRSQPRQRKARRITESGPSGNGISNYHLSQTEALTSREGSILLVSGSQAADSQWIIADLLSGLPRVKAISNLSPNILSASGNYREGIEARYIRSINVATC